MKDPVELGNAIFDRAEIAAVLRQDGDVLVFLKSGKAVAMRDTLSREELAQLTTPNKP